MSAQPRRAPLLLHSALVSESTMSSSNATPLQHGALEAELLHAPPELSAQLEDARDVHSEVGVSLDTLRRLRLLSGSHVLVSTRAGVSRLARVVALDAPRGHSPQVADGVAYVAPVLAFNLQLVLHLSPFLGAQRPQVFLQPVDNVATVRSARVALVREPADAAEMLASAQPPDTTEELDAALRVHFSTARLLAQGDVFTVPVVELASDDSAPRLTHFKVLSAEPMSGLLCEESMSLVLDGSAAAAAPPSRHLARFCDASPHVTPRMAHPAVEQVCRLAAPLMHPSATQLRLRVSVLLKGPLGVGKRAVAQSVADALGMNIVVYNCHELAPGGGGNEGKTAQTLGAAFEAAAAYAPAVLLLRRFGALAAPVAQGVPDANVSSVKPAPLLARALERCIRQHGSANNARGQPDAGAADGVDDGGDDEDDDDDGGPRAGEAPAFQPNGGDGPDGQGQPRTRLWHRPKAGIAAGSSAVLLMAAVEHADGLPPDVRRCFTHEVEVQPPDEPTRANMLKEALGRCAARLDVSAAAAGTAGLMPRDLRALAADAAARAVTRAAATNALSEATIIYQGDLDDALQRTGSRTSAAIGAPKVPDVTWDDVGGLEEAKRAITDTVQLPLRHRALFTSGGRRRSGCLLYGPPGTGKTLLAKAVATQCGVRFLAVKGPELINMYIGESERNVREVFARARAAAPCIVFFDELDALAPARGSGGDSGGVMDRVVSQLLAEVDGLSNGGATVEDVFVIGATNRPDLIDPALLRPGRFDKLLFVGVDDSQLGRLRVLQALTRRFVLSPDVSLDELAKRCPKRYTGADLYALCADAWMRAVKTHLARAGAGATAAAVQVAMADFTGAMADLAPSLSADELARYQTLAASFDGKTLSSEADAYIN